MNDLFEKRVRAAAVAGWWTLLADVLVITWAWIAYLLAMSARPEWLISVWGGGDISWAYIQNMWMWAILILKVFMWVVAMAVLWLTLWARQLRRLG